MTPPRVTETVRKRMIENPPIASDGLPARSTGPWVYDKKHYFERYLDIFSRGIGPKWARKICYVDLFKSHEESSVGIWRKLETWVMEQCKTERSKCAQMKRISFSISWS